jgi:hypothetical protein
VAAGEFAFNGYQSHWVKWGHEFANDGFAFRIKLTFNCQWKRGRMAFKSG